MPFRRTMLLELRRAYDALIEAEESCEHKLDATALRHAEANFLMSARILAKRVPMLVEAYPKDVAGTGSKAGQFEERE